MADLERLRHLRRVVEEAPQDRFKMESFHQFTECGSAYCAAGWTAIDPWFQANTPIGGFMQPLRDGFCYPKGGVHLIHDLAAMFGIAASDTGTLFGFPDYLDMNKMDEGDASRVTRAEVLANIDRLISGLPIEPYVAA